MSQIVAPVLIELEHEAATTRRLLERVPEGKFDWQPHPTSMNLKRLATHIAETPGIFAAMLALDGMELGNFKYTPPEIKNLADILALHDKSIDSAKQFLAGLSDDQALVVWRFTREGKELWGGPTNVLGAHSDVESLDSSPRPTVSLFADAGSADPVDLWPQRRR